MYKKMFASAVFYEKFNLIVLCVQCISCKVSIIDPLEDIL